MALVLASPLRPLPMQRARINGLRVTFTVRPPQRCWPVKLILNDPTDPDATYNWLVEQIQTNPLDPGSPDCQIIVTARRVERGPVRNLFVALWVTYPEGIVWCGHCGASALVKFPCPAQCNCGRLLAHHEPGQA